jgi:dTDP-4-dehydrorhamnose reductase
MRKQILLLGKNGQIGWELQHTLASIGNVIACDRSTANLADPQSLVKVIRDVNPNIIVNAAAYTAVDKAESEPALAMQINGTAPGILAEEAKKIGSILIHYSTDYVFDGKSQTPYRETDTPNPLNVYGQTKFAGEQAIQAVGGKHLILRTTWVYGNRGHNFFLTMLRLGKERPELKIVNDQIGAPTWCRFIAQASADMIRQCLIKSDLWGLYHLTADNYTSWHGFAETIFKHLNFPNAPRLMAIPSTEYPLPAKRPLYSVLSNQKIQNSFRIYSPSWKSLFESCITSAVI